MPRLVGDASHARLQDPLLNREEGVAVELEPDEVPEFEMMREGDTDTESDDEAEAPQRTLKQKVLAVCGSLPVQVTLLCLLIVDLIVLIVLIIKEEVDGDEDEALLGLHVCTTINAGIFVIEIWLRAWATGFGNFVGPAAGSYRKWNIAEIIVISVCFCTEVLSLALTESMGRSSQLVGPVLIGIFRVFRFLRVGRLLVVAYGRKEQVKKKARKMVSADRRRFREDGFDLDLTYITDKIIAMSWPSSGAESFYRNPIGQVAELLDMRHKDNYKVFNLCSERHYDTEPFHGRVEQFLLDDHNPGNLSQLHGFCTAAEEWMAGGPQRVIVVHCKGGKGRTGTMICAWLLWSKQKATADDALRLFGELRTDDGPSVQFQGVESPSQGRYVRYFDTYCNQLGRVVQPAKLLLDSIEVGPLPKHCPHAGALWCVVMQGSEKKLLWTSHPGRRLRNWQDEEVDLAASDLPSNQRFQAITQSGGAMEVLEPTAYAERYNGGRLPRGHQFVKYEPNVVLTTDTRVHFFYEAGRTVADHRFAVWFHPSFVDASQRLSVARSDVDKAHKDRSCKRFAKNFVVEFSFSDAGGGAVLAT
eukprot:TRINITY_DN13956_c0_g5_i1.p1 TRINITY_DN13956_c0_g5~~TRINITY_DN13956_c0_g5_i1.p1  ORF type:complete len:587 (+),score=130.64 TRINITY_DN13956_c0_g5_i1:75-1835(+)